MEKLNIDSGILQFVPKGAYYEGKDEQFNQVYKMWNDLFKFDRTLFSLLMLLNGTGFAKGMMTHLLLSNPIQAGDKALVPEGLSFDYETKVILFNLSKENVPRALKNLLILAGSENQKRINNTRTRKIILEYIFNRDNESLDNLAIAFKQKLKTLIRHALGKQDLYKILNGDNTVFQKYIGKFNPGALPVICHLFDSKIPTKGAHVRFPQIEKYKKMKEAAKKGDLATFEKMIPQLPQRTVIGFRNLYKLNIEKAKIFEKAKMSDKESIQMEAAVKRSGGTREINYNNQDIYDLWKALYFKASTNDKSNIDKIMTAIENQSKKLDKINIGECSVVIDASHSMYGSEQRPLHPMLTALCIISVLDNIKNVFYVGGKVVNLDYTPVSVVFPENNSPLWRGLVDAIISGSKNIVLISDGYENTVKGMFEKVYEHFKNSGYDFKLLHINPVFSADAKTGTIRTLAKDVKPLPVTNYKFLETEIIFNKMIENRDMVKKLLVAKYQKLLENKKEVK